MILLYILLDHNKKKVERRLLSFRETRRNTYIDIHIVASYINGTVLSRVTRLNASSRVEDELMDPPPSFISNVRRVCRESTLMGLAAFFRFRESCFIQVDLGRQNHSLCFLSSSTASYVGFMHPALRVIFRPSLDIRYDMVQSNSNIHALEKGHEDSR